MRKKLLITRGALVGLLVCAAGLLAAVVWIWILSGRLSDQVDENKHTLTLVCKLTTGLALNQPNLDPQFLRVLNQVIGELPSKCFP